MNWLLIALAVFVVFNLVMVFALCRAARIGDEMAEHRRQQNAEGGDGR